MMNKVIVLGMFLLVGLVAGAFIISSAGQEKPEENDPNPVDNRIDGLARRMDSFERRISEIDAKMEEYLLALEASNRTVRELQNQLAAAGEESASGKGSNTSLADSSGGLGIGKHDIIENIKEEVKKEIKEETKIAERREKAQGVKKWAESQTQGLRKRMDEQFVQFAQKIRLDRNQEIAVKDITENLIKQIQTIWGNWEERLAEGMTDDDWSEFKGELGEVYDNAHEQLLQHVAERQAKAIMGFIEGGGGK
jgi:hypothetical protein